MNDQEPIDSFIAKWRARWPEWAIAEVFVPADQRTPALAWAALVQELTDAAWGGNDPLPGEAKLGWWLEELQGWTRGLRRHPLGQVLQKRPAPWPGLAAALPSLRSSRERPVDAEEARQQLRAFAMAMAEVERVLFGGEAAESGVEAVVSSLLHLRLAHYPTEAAPLQVLAQSGSDAAVATWTAQLAERTAAEHSVARPRRLWGALAAARLRRGRAQEPLPQIRALWVAWRAARG